MKVYKMSNGGYSKSYTIDSIELETDLFIEEITKYYEKLNIQDGVLSVSDEDREIVDNEIANQLLREERSKECFVIINRGKFWYDKLEEYQLSELLEWYDNWLDVTETKVIPEKPNWIE